MKTIIFAFIICANFSMCLCYYRTYFMLAKPVPSDVDPPLADYTNLKVLRNRSLNGTFVYRTDFNNDDYIIVPELFTAAEFGYGYGRELRLKPLPACEFFEIYYTRFAQPMFLGKSNFPIYEDGKPCPVPKGEYYLKEGRSQNITNQVPRLNGRRCYKTITTFRDVKKDISVGGLELIFCGEDIASPV